MWCLGMRLVYITWYLRPRYYNYIPSTVVMGYILPLGSVLSMPISDQPPCRKGDKYFCNTIRKMNSGVYHAHTLKSLSQCLWILFIILMSPPGQAFVWAAAARCVHRRLQSCVPGQDLATLYLMRNCGKRILSLHSRWHCTREQYLPRPPEIYRKPNDTSL